MWINGEIFLVFIIMLKYFQKLGALMGFLEIEKLFRVLRL